MKWVGLWRPPKIKVGLKHGLFYISVICIGRKGRMNLSICCAGGRRNALFHDAGSPLPPSGGHPASLPLDSNLFLRPPSLERLGQVQRQFVRAKQISFFYLDFFSVLIASITGRRILLFYTLCSYHRIRLDCQRENCSGCQHSLDLPSSRHQVIFHRLYITCRYFIFYKKVSICSFTFNEDHVHQYWQRTYYIGFCLSNSRFFCFPIR